jgi:hypothetical protein
MSSEIPEKPAYAAKHGPESRLQTVRADETHGPDQDRITSILTFWAPPPPARSSHAETRRRGVSNTLSPSRHKSHMMLATAVGL